MRPWSRNPLGKCKNENPLKEKFFLLVTFIFVVSFLTYKYQPLRFRLAEVWTGTCKNRKLRPMKKKFAQVSMYFLLRWTTHMLLKPAVLKGSLATGFGVGAGPGVPGDPKTSRIYSWIVGSCGLHILWRYDACWVFLTKSINDIEAEPSIEEVLAAPLPASPPTDPANYNLIWCLFLWSF